MTFEELAVGSTFSLNKQYLVKIDQIRGNYDGEDITLNAQDLDTNILWYVAPWRTVTMDRSRDKFEQLWAANKQPIDKALCYEFYKLGVNSK